MGNWNINIQGIGCHHNENNPTDADLMAAKFVSDLRVAGHLIETASFTHGGKVTLARSEAAKDLRQLLSWAEQKPAIGDTPDAGCTREWVLAHLRAALAAVEL